MINLRQLSTATFKILVVLAIGFKVSFLAVLKNAFKVLYLSRPFLAVDNKRIH